MPRLFLWLPEIHPNPTFLTQNNSIDVVEDRPSFQVDYLISSYRVEKGGWQISDSEDEERFLGEEEIYV